MVPLTQGSERSLGLWQTYKVVFAASINMQLCMVVMHGRQHEGGLLLSTLHSGHARPPCGKVVISSLEAPNPILNNHSLQIPPPMVEHLGHQGFGE